MHSPVLTRGFCFKVCGERSRKGWFLGNSLLVLTQCVAGLAAAAAAGEVPWNRYCQAIPDGAEGPRESAFQWRSPQGRLEVLMGVSLSLGACLN